MKTIKIISLVFFFFICQIASSSGKYYKKGIPSQRDEHQPQKQQAVAFLKNQPVEFIENHGQMSDINGNPVPFVLFKAEAPGVDLYITDKGLQYVFIKAEEDEDENENQFNFAGLPGNEHEKLKISYEKIEMQLLNSSIKKENVVLEDSSMAYFNFMMDRAPKIINHVRKYKKIIVKNIYPGIDWVLNNSDKKGFKYDFVVHPGADPHQIEMVYHSKHQAEIDEQGNLAVPGQHGSIKENSPYSYFAETGKDTKIIFRINSISKIKGQYESLVSFKLPNIYKSNVNTLIIDPQIVWFTFYGGIGADMPCAIEADKTGNFFVTGRTGASLPLQNAGTFYQTITGQSFIAKFSNTGVLIWATYYGGGNLSAFINDLVIDKFNNVFLCGASSNSLFPLVNANTYFQPSLAGGSDAFISKFDNSGNCLWATFYGGSATEEATSISTDLNGNIFVVGQTGSANFPLQNAGTYFEASITPTTSGFVLKFDNSGNRMWATYLKGIPAFASTVDQNSNLYLVGKSTSTTAPILNPGGGAFMQNNIAGQSDLVICKFSNLGNQIWTTYYGGSSNEGIGGLKTDSFGNLILYGITSSTNLPLQNSGTYFQSSLLGVQDVFLAKFSPLGSLLWASLFGGSRDELHIGGWANRLALDSCNNLHLIFSTNSRNVPLQFPCDSGFFDSTYDTTFNVNNTEVYYAKFSNNGAFKYGTYLGGDGNDFEGAISIDRQQNVFITGYTSQFGTNISYPIPVVIGPYYSNFNFATDAFFTKIKNKIPSPTAPTFSYQNNICVSDTNHLPVLTPGFQAGGTFSSQPGLAINPLNGQITSSFSIPGTYSVNYFNAPCFCYSVATLQMGSTIVQIIPVPTIAVAAPAPICAGFTAMASASGANSYTWMPGSLIGSTQSFSPAVSTAYTVTGSNIACTSAPFIFTITVNPSPTVVVPSSTICENESIVVNASGANGYIWNPGVLTGSVQTFNPPSSTAYTVTGTSNQGCVSQSTFNIFVSACTGIDTDFTKAGLKVFPNPSKGEITVLSAEDLQLQLYVADGKLVREMHLTASNNYKITIEGLAKGVYFLRANGSDKNSGHKIIVEN